ncbi:hypothetical protein [Streptomyces bicolor]|uniref:hypothetical protein n=1 Tax=Streptomyces bicolor TaxID=66874 RepID=UPI0004E2365A|nr:hypothetical protein [Streptomyces bicolor]
MELTGRRRSWRWVVVAWVIVVAVAGGATLWLQDAAEPLAPYRWEEASATPSPPEELGSACPSPSAYEGGVTQVFCLRTSR